MIATPVDGRRYVALVQGHDGAWRLPKGHVEAGESLEAAALREVTEETSLGPKRLAVRDYLGSYLLNEHSGSPEGKRNHFFLMHLICDELPAMKTDPEHREAAWWLLPLQSLPLAYQAQESLIRSYMTAELPR